ncbi:MAG: PaaI family thioesterase [Myxococcota bacterium]
MNDAHFRALERMYATAPINDFYAPTMTVSDGAAEIHMDVAPTMFHAGGAMHGSVYFKMLDDAAFFAANSLVEDVFVLTAQFNLYLMRPIQSGRIRAVGTVTNRTRRTFTADAALFNEDHRKIAAGSGLFMLSNVALSPEIGYHGTSMTNPS